MGKKLRCPVFVFIQGAYLCLHLCLFVHVMLTSAPAASLFRVWCVLYQREPQEPPLSTVPAEKGPPNIANIPMTENSYLQKCYLSNTAWSTGSFFSHPQRFWSSWTDVSNFNDKNDFNLQFMASICSGPPHLSPPKPLPLSMEHCFMISHKFHQPGLLTLLLRIVLLSNDCFKCGVFEHFLALEIFILHT